MKEKWRLEAAERRLEIASRLVGDLILRRESPRLILKARIEELSAMRALIALNRARIEK